MLRAGTAPGGCFLTAGALGSLSACKRGQDAARRVQEDGRSKRAGRARGCRAARERERPPARAPEPRREAVGRREEEALGRPHDGGVTRYD